ncbi:MAG: lipoprotein [Parvibaculaceae bacterium]
MTRTLLLVALAASLGLAACGKKGPPGPPHQEQEQEQERHRGI